MVFGYVVFFILFWAFSLDGYCIVTFWPLLDIASAVFLYIMMCWQDTKQEDKETQEKEIARLTNIIETMKNGNEKIVEIQQEIEIKHQKEMEDLRRYFEQKCTDLEKK